MAQDNRFTPIGGMFSGVRGVTVNGGASEYRDKLVRLNENGVIDMSCLDGAIQDMLENMTSDLFARVSQQLEALTTRDLQLGDSIASISRELTKLKEYVDSNDTSIRTDVTTELSALRSHVDSNDTNIRNSITELKEYVDSNDSSILLKFTNLSSELYRVIAGLKQDMNKLKELIGELTGTNVDQIDGSIPNNLAPVFSENESYASGNLVMYKNVLYRFTADHNQMAWTGSDVEPVTIGEVVGELSALLTNLHVVLQLLTGEE